MKNENTKKQNYANSVDFLQYYKNNGTYNHCLTFSKYLFCQKLTFLCTNVKDHHYFHHNYHHVAFIVIIMVII